MAWYPNDSNFDTKSGLFNFGESALKLKEGEDIEYLPFPRDAEHPNARGGAIFIIPKAPNDRLDL